VMALHQAGFSNAVATCGTAVGVEHLRMVSRYAQRVVLAFDGDAAGVKAAERAWEGVRALQTEGGGVALDLRVLALPDGRDPADLVREVGAEGVRTAVDEATPVVPFVIRHHLASADLRSEAGRTAALHDVIEVLGREPDLDLRREWARTEIAAGVNVSYDFVVRSAARLGVELDAHEGVATTRTRTRPAAGTTLDRARVKLERDVLRVVLQHPALLPEEWQELGEPDFTHPMAVAIHRAIGAGGGAGVPLAQVLAAAPDDELRGVLRALALEDDPDTADPEVAPAVAAGRVKRLLADRLATQELELREQLSRLNHLTDRDELTRLQRRLIDLQQRRRELTTVVE
jgi:DNA primase